MPYYKDANNQIHHLDSEEFEYLLPTDCLAISDEEFRELRRVQELPESIDSAKGELYALVAQSHANFISRKTGNPSTQEVASWKAKRDLAVKLENGIEPEADELAFLVAAGATDDAGRKAVAARIMRKAIAYGEILGDAETRRNACHADIATLSDVAQEPDIRAAIYARWEDL